MVWHNEEMESPMKSLAAACALLSLLLFFGLSLPVRASVTAQAVIDQRIDVLLDFVNINSSVWDKIQNNRDLFNGTTFPKIIIDNLEVYGLNATFSLPDNPIKFDNLTKSMNASFYLSGSDIISFSFNRDTMAKTYRVRTEWRKFYANFTDAQGEQILFLNFAEYFGTPVSSWEKINYTLNGKEHPAYFCNFTTAQSDFDPLFYFVLPAGAINVQANGDTIIFEFPPDLGDILLNSPFPIVGALIIITIAIVLYRKVRR
jgi:hypothetical protein